MPIPLASQVPWQISCPVLFCLMQLLAAPCLSDESVTPAQSRAAMLKAARFFAEQVSADGGYLYRYSSDLRYREGEGIAGPMTAWIEPPGTPAIGEAYLAAYQLTGEAKLLEYATQTARALLRGQLESGGWDSSMELGGEARQQYAYRTQVEAAKGTRRRNTTTLDDNKTQSAVRFLMNLDRQLHHQDPEVSECIAYALEHLLAAQYPNGGWPQRFSEPPDPDEYPVVQASFPETWPRSFPKQNYAGYYTFNDNAIADMIDVMYRAYWIYQDERFRESAHRAGDFILLAQLPEPQPAWAQQYNRQMHPAWARKFEPPAVTGGESQGVLQTLLTLAEYSGEQRFLDAVPRALQYLEASALDDGKLARFYEIGTNRPLYFTRSYELTYDDGDLPTHYAFKVGNRLPQIRRRYEQLRGGELRANAFQPTWEAQRVKASSSLSRRATAVVKALDERGAWVETGTLQQTGEREMRVIESRTFMRNLRILAEHSSALE